MHPPGLHMDYTARDADRHGNEKGRGDDLMLWKGSVARHVGVHYQATADSYQAAPITTIEAKGEAVGVGFRGTAIL